jgi:hypothetical protein
MLKTKMRSNAEKGAVKVVKEVVEGAVKMSSQTYNDNMFCWLGSVIEKEVAMLFGEAQDRVVMGT